nr:EAL domain-containing protein [Exilibacterium tricleocarpae]
MPSKPSRPLTAFGNSPLPKGAPPPSESGDLLQLISDAVVTFDRLGRIYQLNAAAKNLFGLAEANSEAKPLRQIFPGLSDEQIRGADSILIKNARLPVATHLTGFSSSGREVRLTLLAARVVEDDYCQLLLREVSEGDWFKEDLLQQRDILQATLANVSDAVITTNARTEVETLNAVARQILGLSTHEGLGVPVDQLFTLYDAEGQRPLPSLVMETLARGTRVQVEGQVQLYSADQPSPVIVTAQVIPLRNSANHISGSVMVLRSVNEAAGASSHLNWQVNHDVLTQLPNRHHFEAELARAVTEAASGEISHGLLYVDLYHFKLINDTCGHTAGDELLRQLAVLFGKRMRSQDVLARLGSDEFGVLLRNCTLAGTQRVADTLLRELQAFRFLWNEQQYKVGISVGAVMIDQNIDSEAQALSAANAACCAAKEAGRNRIHFYHNDNALVQRRSEMHWVVKINEALAENRLVLYRQPIVASAPLLSELPHYEVLVRMMSPEGELIPPVEFIPAAERYGLMDEIDRWVVRNLLQYMRRRRDAGLPEESYAVNLSGVSLGDESFCEFVWNELAESAVKPKLLHFEITETVAVSNLQRAVEFMELFGESGCKFFLDDFGSGLSSFAYLKDFPIDYLKIDGTFVKGMEEDSTNFAMVSTINHLAHVMGIKTVAEYVENDVLLEWLRAVGVDYVQGYGIAMPAPLPSVGALPQRS